MKNKNNMMLAAFLGGMGVAGYMYLQCHPETMQNMKKMIRRAAKRTYEMMEEVD